MEEKGHSLPDKQLSFTEKLSLKDETQRLIKSLSAKYRTALMLRYFEGLTYDEIAEVLDIPLGTVKSRINAAITTLRERQKRTEEESGA